MKPANLAVCCFCTHPHGKGKRISGIVQIYWIKKHNIVEWKYLMYPPVGFVCLFLYVYILMLLLKIVENWIMSTMLLKWEELNIIKSPLSCYFIKEIWAYSALLFVSEEFDYNTGYYKTTKKWAHSQIPSQVIKGVSFYFDWFLICFYSLFNWKELAESA